MAGDAGGCVVSGIDASAASAAPEECGMTSASVAATNQTSTRWLRKENSARITFYRVNVIRCGCRRRLRDRREDIPLLAEHFLPSIPERDG